MYILGSMEFRVEAAGPSSRFEASRRADIFHHLVARYLPLVEETRIIRRFDIDSSPGTHYMENRRDRPRLKKMETIAD